MNENQTWRLEGFDTYANDPYPMAEEYATEREALLAARNYLLHLEDHQPTESSGGQSGIQDRVYVLPPNGRPYRVTLKHPAIVALPDQGS